MLMEFESDLVVKHAADVRQLAAEAATLRAFGEHRAVKVCGVRPDRHAMVLERIRPGTALGSEVNEEQAMQVVAQLLAARWPDKLLEPSLYSFAEFALALDCAGEQDHHHADSIRDARLLRARSLREELQQDHQATALLHGDLHYGNVLKSDRAGCGYLLIDPKGVVGEPAFDVGYLVSRAGPCARDRLPIDRVVDMRLAFLPAATRQDPHRVAAYACVAAALSVAWAREDHDGCAADYEEILQLLEAHPLARA